MLNFLEDVVDFRSAFVAGIDDELMQFFTYFQSTVINDLDLKRETHLDNIGTLYTFEKTFLCSSKISSASTEITNMYNKIKACLSPTTTQLPTETLPLRATLCSRVLALDAYINTPFNVCKSKFLPWDKEKCFADLVSLNVIKKKYKLKFVIFCSKLK